MTRPLLTHCPECMSGRVHRTTMHHRRYRWSCADCHWVGKRLTAHTAMPPIRVRLSVIRQVPAPAIIFTSDEGER